MRHVTLEELLRLEDGESIPDLEEHLASCPECAAERRSLASRRAQLRALPVRRSGVDGWQAVRRAVVRSRRQRQAGMFAMALAASLLVFVAMPSLHRPRVVQPTTAQPVSSAPPPAAQGIAAAPSELDLLKQKSRALEVKLQQLPEPQSVGVVTASTVVQLEDQLAGMDQILAHLPAGKATPEEVSALWKMRIELLEALIAQRSPPLKLVSL